MDKLYSTQSSAIHDLDKPYTCTLVSVHGHESASNKNMIGHFGKSAICLQRL